MSSTAEATAKWQRHIARTPWWCAAYWDSDVKPIRAAVVQALEALVPFQSVLELGCGAGGLLRAIARAYPDATLHGLDVSPEAVAFARTHLPQGQIHEGSMTTWPYPAVDVIVSSYALAYCAPEDLGLVLHRIMGARLGCVLAEPMVRDGFAEGPCVDADTGEVFPTEWRHDYLRRLQARHPDALIVTVPVPEPPDRLNAILIARWRSA